MFLKLSLFNFMSENYQKYESKYNTTDYGTQARKNHLTIILQSTSQSLYKKIYLSAKFKFFISYQD